MPTVPGKGEQDYRVFIGARSFDPKEAAQARRRRRSAVAGPQARALVGEPLLVQFTQALGVPDIERLRDDYGLKLEDFVPHLAFIELVAPAVIDALRRDFLVRTTMAIDPTLKIAPNVGSGAPAPGVEPFFDAALVRGSDAAAVAADITALGARDVHTQEAGAGAGFSVVRFALDDAALVAQVADIEEVLWIEPLGEARDDNGEAAGAVQGVSGHPLWERGLHGENHLIGHMDRGPPDIAHCFFADTPNNPGPGHRKLAAVPRNAALTALAAHSTVTAAIAAGDDRNIPGSNANRGGAWAARLVCGNRLDLQPPVSNSMITELTAAAASGAFVHTNSWHWDTTPTLPVGTAPVYTLLDWSVDQFSYQNENHLVLGSAGNTGEELGPPGTAKNALCVAAAQGRPNEMNFGDGNPGPTADGRRKPDLMAVGCGIRTAQFQTPCGLGAANCSASRATPNAAAAAVLVRQYFTEGWYPSGEKEAKNAITPTGALLKAMLLNSTVDMTGAGAAGYPSNAEGWGLIRLERTLYFRGQRRKMRIWDQRHATGPTPPLDIIQHEFEIEDNTEQLKVTLVWTDPPPAFFGFLQTPPVNDLNLRVTAPDGTDYLGNDFVNGVSRPNGTTTDTVNNVEMVIVNNPPPGKWELEVHGVINVGNPGQGYALVATANLKRKRCFVATAVYGGDPDHPDVCLIRDWRDGELSRGGARGAVMGTFAAAYERVGPVLAGVVERRPRLARALRRRVFEPAVARHRLRR